MTKLTIVLATLLALVGTASAEETQATDFYIRGNVYFSKGEYDKAIADYDQAIRLKPDYADALGNRGTAYYRKGHYDRAITDFTQAIRFRPRDALAYNNRGNAYDDRGDHDRAIADYYWAIADYTQAIELDTLEGSRKAWPFNNRGNTYRAKGQFDRAIADFDQAIRLNPDYAVAFHNRGIAYDDKGQYARAIVDYDQAIRLDPSYAAAIDKRGHSNFYLRRFAAAVPDLARAVESRPEDYYAVIDLYLAQARAGEGGLGNFEANAGHLDLDEWPGPVISMFLGETDAAAVAAMGGVSATREEREKRCEAMYYVGQYHLLHGDQRKAAEFFRAAVATDITYFVEYTGAKAELARSQPTIAGHKGDELFVAHSRDNPSPLWTDLDVTVEEIQRDGRLSIFKVQEHERVVGGAGGRFFVCTVMLLTRQRGYVNFEQGTSIDGRHVVIFLKEHDDDIQALIDSGYREYEPFGRVGAEDFASLEKLCAAAGMQ